MKNSPGRNAAAMMVFIGIFVRLFCGMAIEYSSVYNAAWICPLLGFLFYLPFALAVQAAERIGNDCAWGNLAKRCPPALARAGEMVFALILMIDGALAMRLMANSANVVALGSISVPMLLVPLGGLAIFTVMMGANAEGNSARLWIRILPLLFLVMVLAQFGSYNTAWLSPVLGSGLREIINGSLYCSGCMAVLTLPWMIAVPDNNKRPLLRFAGFAALAAAVLLLLLQMLCPPLVGLDSMRTGRIKLILTNGRITLSLQLVSIALWYGGLIHLIASEAASAACYLHRAFPKAPQWALAAGEGIGMTLLAASSLAVDRRIVRSLNWSFVILGALLALFMLPAFRRREAQPCAE